MTITIIIVLGNSKPTIAKKRVEKAVSIFSGGNPAKNPDGTITKYILFSGKGGSKNPEAYTMRQYALGIPEEYCLYEAESNNTLQNLLYSKRIIQERFGDRVNIIVCTSSFHIIRTELIGKHVFQTLVKYEHTNEFVTDDEYNRECNLIWTFLYPVANN